MVVPLVIGIVCVVVGVVLALNVRGAAAGLAKHHRSPNSTADGAGLTAKTTRGAQLTGAAVLVLGIAFIVAGT